jgi:c-di-GMP-binding flagellar brake protein YcgR
MLIKNPQSGATLKVTTTDLSEGGMAIQVPKGSRPSGRWDVSFTLPGTEAVLAVTAEFAWEGTAAQAGLRFVALSPEAAQQLSGWLKYNSPETEQDDPPVHCQLTDLSLGGCYLEIPSPFPVSTRVTLSMSAGSVELRAEGVVRVMHPDQGMGVEFTQTTPHHRQALEKFLRVLTENRSLLPELLVEPEGLEPEPRTTSAIASASTEVEDPLLGLFRNQAALPADSFLAELRKQRSVALAVSASA